MRLGGSPTGVFAAGEHILGGNSARLSGYRSSEPRDFNFSRQRHPAGRMPIVFALLWTTLTRPAAPSLRQVRDRETPADQMPHPAEPRPAVATRGSSAHRSCTPGP